MRTLSQIQSKANNLQTKLKKKSVCENFGDTEQRKLADYIGDIYEYDYNTRQRINSITYWFSNWCSEWCGC